MPAARAARGYAPGGPGPSRISTYFGCCGGGVQGLGAQGAAGFGAAGAAGFAWAGFLSFAIVDHLLPRNETAHMTLRPPDTVRQARLPSVAAEAEKRSGGLVRLLRMQRGEQPGLEPPAFVLHAEASLRGPVADRGLGAASHVFSRCRSGSSPEGPEPRSYSQSFSSDTENPLRRDMDARGTHHPHTHSAPVRWPNNTKGAGPCKKFSPRMLGRSARSAWNTAPVQT